MASPTVVTTATQGMAVSFSTSSCRPAAHRPPLLAPPRNPPSVLHFPSKSRRWGLRVAARVPCCRFVAACLKSSLSFGLPEEDGPSVEDSVASASPSSAETTFDMKLPRRNLLVQFTCNSCGERTQRIVNRVAYERGTVFVQNWMNIIFSDDQGGPPQATTDRKLHCAIKAITSFKPIFSA